MNTYISTGEGDRTELLNKIAAYRQNCRVLLSVMELREQLDAKKLLLLPHLAANHGVGLHHQAKVMMEHEAYALSMEEILTTEGMNAKVQEKMEADGIAPHTAYQLLLTEGAITPSEARKTLETGVAEKLYRAFLWLNYARSRGDARAAISLAGLVLSTSDTCKQEYTGVEAAFKTAENYLDEAIKKGNDECRMDARDAMKSLKKLRFNTAFKNERPMEELSFAAQEVIADTKQITKSLPFREATFRKQALRKEVLELVEQKDKKKAVGILDKLEGFAKKRELTATESGKATTLKTQLEGLVKGDATQLVEGIENCVKRANEPADNYTVAELAFRNQILDLALKGSQEAVDEILDQIQKRSEKGLVGIGDIDALAEMAAHGFVAPKIMLQSETMKPYLDRVEKDIKKNIVTAESIQELGILAAHENSRASALLNGLKNSPNKGDDVKKAMQLVEELDVYNRYVDSPKKLKADQIIPVFDSQKRVDKMYLQASFTQKDVQFLEVAAKQNVKGAETLLTLIEERSKPRLPAANTAAEAKPSASEGQPVSQEERDKTRSGNTDTDRELIQAIDQHFTEGKVAASDLLRLKAAGEYDEASNLLKLIINTQGDEAFKNLSDEDLKIARETLIEITSNREQESFQKVEAGDQAAVPALNQLINRRCREGRAEMKDLEYLEAAAKKGSEWAEQLLTEIISNNGSKAFDHLDTASKTSVEQKLVEIDKEREQSAVDGIYLRLEGGGLTAADIDFVAKAAKKGDAGAFEFLQLIAHPEDNALSTLAKNAFSKLTGKELVKAKIALIRLRFDSGHVTSWDVIALRDAATNGSSEADQLLKQIGEDPEKAFGLERLRAEEEEMAALQDPTAKFKFGPTKDPERSELLILLSVLKGRWAHVNGLFDNAIVMLSKKVESNRTQQAPRAEEFSNYRNAVAQMKAGQKEGGLECIKQLAQWFTEGIITSGDLENLEWAANNGYYEAENLLKVIIGTKDTAFKGLSEDGTGPALIKLWEIIGRREKAVVPAVENGISLSKMLRTFVSAFSFISSAAKGLMTTLTKEPTEPTLSTEMEGNAGIEAIESVSKYEQAQLHLKNKTESESGRDFEGKVLTAEFSQDGQVTAKEVVTRTDTVPLLIKGLKTKLAALEKQQAEGRGGEKIDQQIASVKEQIERYEKNGSKATWASTNAPRLLFHTTEDETQAQELYLPALGNHRMQTVEDRDGKPLSTVARSAAITDFSHGDISLQELQDYDILKALTTDKKALDLLKFYDLLSPDGISADPKKYNEFIERVETSVARSYGDDILKTDEIGMKKLDPTKLNEIIQKREELIKLQFLQDLHEQFRNRPVTDDSVVVGRVSLLDMTKPPERDRGFVNNERTQGLDMKALYDKLDGAEVVFNIENPDGGAYFDDSGKIHMPKAFYADQSSSGREPKTTTIKLSFSTSQSKETLRMRVAESY